ncbi:UNKNOWN [Stylonychia lemnae]|uniref:Cyclic nucleotide-binding domain-containing protein n=1 Tax=Stylonychia lemnae TaxID=5949 RepID=A0A078B6Z9_STYLE|nr:UNKNOWN [Stylonychia lemnae]|eukprot:CDW90164.1 UNKNOWN [Stylonychia lemnae]
MYQIVYNEVTEEEYKVAVTELNQLQYFGDIELIYKMPRIQTVLGFSVIERSIEFLYNAPYFDNEDMDVYEVIILAMKSRIVNFQSKAVVIQADQKSKHIHFILSGRFQVIQKLSNGTFIQIDLLEKGDYFGHINILNYDSEVPESNNSIYVYSMLPSECLQIHENDILSLPKRVQTRLKEYSPPYPEEKDLLQEYKDCLKQNIKQKEIVQDFLIRQNKPTTSTFSNEFIGVLKNNIKNAHQKIEVIKELAKSPNSYRFCDAISNDSPSKNTMFQIKPNQCRGSSQSQSMRTKIKDFNMNSSKRESFSLGSRIQSTFDQNATQQNPISTFSVRFQNQVDQVQIEDRKMTLSQEAIERIAKGQTYTAKEVQKRDTSRSKIMMKNYIDEQKTIYQNIQSASQQFNCLKKDKLFQQHASQFLPVLNSKIDKHERSQKLLETITKKETKISMKRRDTQLMIRRSSLDINNYNL